VTGEFLTLIFGLSLIFLLGVFRVIKMRWKILTSLMGG
jgi:hypothetical protein